MKVELLPDFCQEDRWTRERAADACCLGTAAGWLWVELLPRKALTDCITTLPVCVEVCRVALQYVEAGACRVLARHHPLLCRIAAVDDGRRQVGVRLALSKEVKQVPGGGEGG